MRGRPPTMGRTLFGQWVRIFKAMTAAKAMDTLSAVCEHYIGRALTKVGCKRLFFLSSINAKFPLMLSFFFFLSGLLNLPQWGNWKTGHGGYFPWATLLLWCFLHLELFVKILSTFLRTSTCFQKQRYFFRWLYSHTQFHVSMKHGFLFNVHVACVSRENTTQAIVWWKGCVSFEVGYKFSIP